MTDEEIRAIFDELRRVGVDLGRPPGLALGTGFGPGEFIAWLRALPDRIGHDVFAHLLADHISAAAQSVPAESPLPRRSRGAAPMEHARTWPTHAQLDDAIDVLVHEWDPLGARLGELTREAVELHAFNILGGLVQHTPAWPHETFVAVQLGQIEEEEFLVRKSPIEQRRYLARRLCAAVDDNPAPPIQGPPPPDVEQQLTRGRATAKARHVHRGFTGSSSQRSSSCVPIGPSGYEPHRALDPSATCAECGTLGTIAFVTRDIEPHLSQYCRDCWRRVRSWAWVSSRPPSDRPADLIDMFERGDRMRRERIRSAGSALWEDRFDMVDRSVESLAGATDEDIARRKEGLRRFARELVDQADEMDGPMPPNIEAFVREYGSPDA